MAYFILLKYTTLFKAQTDHFKSCFIKNYTHNFILCSTVKEVCKTSEKAVNQNTQLKILNCCQWRKMLCCCQMVQFQHLSVGVKRVILASQTWTLEYDTQNTKEQFSTISSVNCICGITTEMEIDTFAKTMQKAIIQQIYYFCLSYR